MTLIIVFSVTWFGLYLARGITGAHPACWPRARARWRPATSTTRCTARADDEIGILVESFNRMTEDLEVLKAQLEEAYVDLQAKHAELDERRRYTETVLEAVATGVVSLDAAGDVTTINRAASRMLGLAPTAAVGRHYAVAFGAPAYAEIVTLMQRMARLAGRHASSASCSSAATARPSPCSPPPPRSRGPDGEHLGIVLVFDDLTELLEGPAPGRLARGRPAHRPRDQEPAHADPALRPAAAAAPGGPAARRRAASSRSAPRPSSRRSTG